MPLGHVPAHRGRNRPQIQLLPQILQAVHRLPGEERAVHVDVEDYSVVHTNVPRQLDEQFINAVGGSLTSQYPDLSLPILSTKPFFRRESKVRWIVLTVLEVASASSSLV